MSEALPRPVTLLLGPELVWLGVFLFVRLLASRANPEDPAGVAALERMVWLVPVVGVGLAFLAFRVPGAGGWALLARVAVASLAGSAACAAVVVGHFGPGARGQDAGFVISLAVALVLVSLFGTIAAAGIWIGRAPALAAWYREHRALFALGTLAASIPVGIVLLFVVSIALGVVGGILGGLRR